MPGLEPVLVLTFFQPSAVLLSAAQKREQFQSDWAGGGSTYRTGRAWRLRCDPASPASGSSLLRLIHPLEQEAHPS